MKTVCRPAVVLLVLASVTLGGCAVIGGAALVTSSAVSVASTGVSVGAAGAKSLVTTTADVVTYARGTPAPQP